MKHWWEIATPQTPEAPKLRTVAYYRHSAQDRQENSIPIQQDQVRQFTQEFGIEIIKEHADAGKSGLDVEGRPAFTEMMDEWVKKRKDFDYVLCLDVSRFGRFQDIDLSAQYSAECKQHGKQVICTTIGKPREDDPLYPVYVQFERFRAAPAARPVALVAVGHGRATVSKCACWSKIDHLRAASDGICRVKAVHGRKTAAATTVVQSPFLSPSAV